MEFGEMMFIIQFFIFFGVSLKMVYDIIKNKNIQTENIIVYFIIIVLSHAIGLILSMNNILNSSGIDMINIFSVQKFFFMLNIILFLIFFGIKVKNFVNDILEKKYN